MLPLSKDPSAACCKGKRTFCRVGGGRSEGGCMLLYLYEYIHLCMLISIYKCSA